MRTYVARGGTWARKGDYDKAIADCNEAIRLDPILPFAFISRGATWARKGEHDKAIADLNEGIRLMPNYAVSFACRGLEWKQKGEYDKAIMDYSKATNLDPKYAKPFNNLAWLYATCPDAKCRDGKKAVENANKAYQLTDGKDWNCIGTLAAAYAESGDFQKAKEWQAKAIEMAAGDKSASDKDKAEMRSCLELYKQGKPYREELKQK